MRSETPEALDREAAVVEGLSPIVPLMTAILQDQVKQAIEAEVAALPAWVHARNDKPAQEATTKALKPFANVVSLNLLSLGEAVYDLTHMAESESSYKWAGVAVGAYNTVAQGYKFYEVCKAIDAHGFEAVFKKGIVDVAKSMVKVGLSTYGEATHGTRAEKGSLQALMGLRMQATHVQLTGTDTVTPMLNLEATRIDVGAVKHESATHRADSSASINLAMTVEERADLGRYTSAQWEPTVYRVEFARLGTFEDPVEEMVMHGGVFMANMGMGRIKKLVMIDEADTASQAGGTVGGSYGMASGGGTVTAGFKAGDMVKVAAVQQAKIDAIKAAADAVTGAAIDRERALNAESTTMDAVLRPPVARAAIPTDEMGRPYVQNIFGEYVPPITEAMIAESSRGLDHINLEAYIPVRAGYKAALVAGKWVYEKFTTSAAETPSSGASLEKIKNELQEYLGPDYRNITNKSGDKVFLSKDGGRRVRFDVKNPHGDKPHMHIEQKVDGDFVDTTSIHRIRFKGTE